MSHVITLHGLLCEMQDHLDTVGNVYAEDAVLALQSGTTPDCAAATSSAAVALRGRPSAAGGADCPPDRHPVSSRGMTTSARRIMGMVIG